MKKILNSILSDFKKDYRVKWLSVIYFLFGALVSDIVLYSSNQSINLHVDKKSFYEQNQDIVSKKNNNTLENLEYLPLLSIIEYNLIFDLPDNDIKKEKHYRKGFYFYPGSEEKNVFFFQLFDQNIVFFTSKILSTTKILC